MFVLPGEIEAGVADDKAAQEKKK